MPRLVLCECRSNASNPAPEGTVRAVYASKSYLERRRRPQSIEDLAKRALVGFDATMITHRIAAWLHKIAADAVLGARSCSVLGFAYSAKAGGWALRPCQSPSAMRSPISCG